MSAQCPVCPKADVPGLFMSTRPSEICAYTVLFAQARRDPVHCRIFYPSPPGGSLPRIIVETLFDDESRARLSASLREQPKCCVAAKRRYVPTAVIRFASKLVPFLVP